MALVVKMKQFVNLIYIKNIEFSRLDVYLKVLYRKDIQIHIQGRWEFKSISIFRKSKTKFFILKYIHLFFEDPTEKCSTLSNQEEKMNYHHIYTF